jgi:O-antigen/teichoic acid export membrane protein
MLSMQVLIYSGTCIAMLASSIDILIIGSLKGMTTAGIYGFALYLSNLIQVPQEAYRLFRQVFYRARGRKKTV